MLLKRLFYQFIYILINLWGVVSLIFILFNAMQGDPARMILGQQEDEKQLAIIRQKLGTNLPLYQQYLYYLNDLSPISIHHTTQSSHISFLSTEKYTYKQLFSIQNHTKVFVIKFPYLRTSFNSLGKKVSSILLTVLPNTAILAISAIGFSFLLGILLGTFSALLKDTWIDRIIAVLTAMGMSVPSFFSAILIAWVFAFLLKDYTHLNMSGNLYEIDDYGIGKHLTLKNLILPAFTLGIRPLAVITQLMRNALLDVLHHDYIRTARSKGLPTSSIIWKHALRNALNPVITATSGWFASMLAGAVFVEYIFGWNGLGKEIVNALNNLDLPVIMGSVLVISLMFICVNFSLDYIYRYLNPKLK